MPEITGQKPEFNFPSIDNLAEAVSPEREAELKDIFINYTDLVGTVITDQGMNHLYEDLFHIDRFDPLVINDFFIDGIGAEVRTLHQEIKSQKLILPDHYDMTLEELEAMPVSGALSNHILKLCHFMEEIVDFVEGIQARKQVAMRIDYLDSRYGPEGYLHEDRELGIIANFEVDTGAEQDYVVRPLTVENFGEEPEEYGLGYERIAMHSNQLVIIAARLMRHKDGHLIKESVPHGVMAADGQTDGPNHKRLRMMMYQREEVQV